ncbi:PSD1 and planctomycete cytochrome C domain-containing protein [Blastopirellula sp. J2-11]|uniref:PSD1 and planctomycete cytochrome C domain-containing protein n=1 Tax=Blastopirellula sp. J2-11 TaxID=2943192 RepID=UPI0021C645E3|nr:PSD1 and planctomycete cytochrome C domain-containing protein [Blastopirellula sp. J2-11]UUO07394.1 PSD1 and planctomycete cytochrome C domain-containing protein [Blastopirellula sp. J2-11]
MLLRFAVKFLLTIFVIGCAVHLHAEEQAPPISPEHAAEMKAGLDLFKSSVGQTLTTSCLKCHGGESVKADFDLSTREKLLASGYVEQGDADSSYLLALLRHDEEPHMPLRAEKLSDETIAAIGQWIDLGAPYDKPLVDAANPTAVDQDKASDFWSLQPLATIAPAAVTSDWVKSPIDRFVLEKLNEHGITPNPTADRRTLIRRAYFDLLGLPPTPEEVAAFVADQDPDAYGKLIDRLLASPHYGERWARHWMDVARFAESFGYEQDTDRPHAYHYRDFLIQALNDDLPYDKFVAWQLAGDEIAPQNPLAQMATGFLGAGAFPTQLTEAEFEQARYDELDDVVATTGTAFLGLTIGCARCHDHKFDPITSADYYRMASTFTTTTRSLAEIDVPTDAEAKPVTVQVNTEGGKKIPHLADSRGFPHFYTTTHFLTRGDVSQKGEVAPFGFPAVLRNGHPRDYWEAEEIPSESALSYRRTALANWMTDTEAGAGGLLARVIVNRLWHHHFGRGIVATPSDFGVQGDQPSHPALLEWLAVDLIHNGWQLKRMHKQIMTSQTYMQSAAANGEQLAADPQNVLLWRHAPRRLEAEGVRDAMLSVSGQLDPTMFGPGTLDEGMKRRSVYFFIKRSRLIPTMMLFDWPEHLVSIGSRSETTTAPQALSIMNSPHTRSYAESFAAALPSGSVEERITAAYQKAVQRDPTEQELKAASEFIAAQAQRDGENGQQAALVDLCQALFGLNEFIYID